MNEATKTYSSKSTAKRALKRKYNDDVAARVDEFLTKKGGKLALDFDAIDETLAAEAAELKKQKHKAENTTIQDEILRVSEIESPCATVWAIAEQMEEADPNVRRKDIIQACVDQGIAYYTARTQVQHYKQAKKEAEATRANAAKK